MKLTSLLHKSNAYSSLTWHESLTTPGVRFAVKRISLGQRIELTARVRELTGKYAFLKAGDTEEQIEAVLSDLLVSKLYLEWALERVEGMTIDGELASAESLIQKGPEDLANEIGKVIQSQITLSDEEIKNF